MEKSKKSLQGYKMIPLTLFVDTHKVGPIQFGSHTVNSTENDPTTGDPFPQEVLVVFSVKDKSYAIAGLIES